MRAPILTGVVAGIVLAVALIGVAEIKRSEDHAVVHREVEALKARLGEEPLKSIKVAVDGFQRDKKTLEDKVNLIERLRASRYCPESLLAAVDPGAASDPQIDEVSITMPTVAVGGTAAGEAKVRAMAAALGGPPVSLEISNARSEGPQFSIVGVLRGTACPPDEEKEK